MACCRVSAAEPPPTVRPHPVEIIRNAVYVVVVVFYVFSYLFGIIKAGPILDLSLVGLGKALKARGTLAKRERERRSHD